MGQISGGEFRLPPVSAFTEQINDQSFFPGIIDAYAATIPADIPGRELIGLLDRIRFIPGFAEETLWFNIGGNALPPSIADHLPQDLSARLKKECIYVGMDFTAVSFQFPELDPIHFPFGLAVAGADNSVDPTFKTAPEYQMALYSVIESLRWNLDDHYYNVRLGITQEGRESELLVASGNILKTPALMSISPESVKAIAAAHYFAPGFDYFESELQRDEVELSRAAGHLIEWSMANLWTVYQDDTPNIDWDSTK